jgi:xylan 1,4-beta-xylosidase
MTEYENSDWFMANSGDPDESAVEYCKLYDYTVQALIDVIGKDVFVGAHAMAVTEGLWDERIFINHCANGTNYKTGEKGTRLCYLATSFYDDTPGEFTKGKTLPECVEYLRETAESVGLNDLIYGVGEGRILEGNSSGRDSSELLTRTCGYTYQAAYDARLITQMFNNDIAYFSAWSYLSNGFFQGNPTVSYHVASNAAKWGGNKLLATEKKTGIILGSDVDAVSAFDEDENTLRIMAYNFKNDVDYKKNVEMTFEINAPQFDGKNVKVRAYVINDDCNYFDEWVEDRKTYNITDDCFAWSPDDPQIDSTITLADEDARKIYLEELYPKYTQCSKLEPVDSELEVIDGKITLNITLDPHAVVFYEITE